MTYEALHRLIYIREADIINELYPCLLAILSVIERPQNRTSVVVCMHLFHFGVFFVFVLLISSC